MHQISKVAAAANAIIILMAFVMLHFTVFGFSNEFNLAEIVECIGFANIRQDMIKKR